MTLSDDDSMEGFISDSVFKLILLIDKFDALGECYGFYEYSFVDWKILFN